jgi:hypothetical protein
MPQRRRVFADRINYRGQAPPPRAQDPLCAIAPLLRVRPELQSVCRFASQWGVPHDAEPAGWAQFHIVTTGNCLLERSGGHPLRLEAGDVLLLPHGDAHVVRSSARMCGSKSPIRIEHGNAIETKTNTEGKAATELICGRLHFEAATDSLVIATLPDVIVLRLGKEPLLDRMRMLVRAIHDELKGGRLGALAVATDLASALFVQMLRVHCERASGAGRLGHVAGTRPRLDAGRFGRRGPRLARQPCAHLSQDGGRRTARFSDRPAPWPRTSEARLDGGLNSARCGRGRISIRKRLCTRLSPALQNDAWQDQGLAHHVSLFHQNKRTCRRI